ncbi:MAG: CHAT domain-containing protein, partial [candidate division KSB1 bacterium]|nr:CHAT domain-containing protein [candidate division KSB1 bacterium]
SIRRRVQAEVDTLRKHFSPDTWTRQNTPLDSNIYQVEIDLKRILRQAMLARVRGDKLTFQAIMHQAKFLADSIDRRTDTNYWRPWVAKVNSFDADKAMTWLQADRAERLCWHYHLTAFIDAERYGALGLQLLQQAEDARLRLDIRQWLLIILRRFRGMYDLLYPWAQREILKADEIKYHLRANGILFHYATTLHLAGRNQQALRVFGELIERVNQHSQVPDIAWYEINGRLGIAETNWQLGNYEKALSICTEVDKCKLDYIQKILLHHTKGLVYKKLGNYDKAEDEYHKTLTIAESTGDIVNQIIAFNNLGSMNYQLTEYDKAESYYDTAMALLQKYNPQNVEKKIMLLSSLAELKAAQNEIDDFNDLVGKANDLIELINLPIVKAEFLRWLAQLNMNVQKYQQAHDFYLKALKIYEDSGLLRAGLDSKIRLIESLISLSKYQEARQMLDDLYETAVRIHDEPSRIEAIGLLARVAYKEGKIDEAIQRSNQLISLVEKLSLRFSDLDNLTAYHQKVHDYLKEAVIYELEKGRLDSAFIKLDYLKARSSKNNLGISSGHPSPACLIEIETLKSALNEKQLVLSYFVTQDTLYAFVLQRDNLRLFKTPITLKHLSNLVTTYMNSINKSIAVLQSSRPADFAVHYDSTMTLGDSLYQILLGWPELQARLQNTELIYIIPDVPLYEVPFSCLNCSKRSDSPFLIHQTAVVNLPGVAFLKSPIRAKNHHTDGKRVLVSIDRGFPGVDDLISFIKKQFPLAEELIVEKLPIGKEEILSRLNQKYDIYILVGHSVANPKIPDLSTFELTTICQADSSTKTVELTLADLKSIDWSQTELVLLSGCETAKGKLYKGTGLAGIQQGILALGAREVLASLWKIDAYQANRQMINFLKAWGQNRPSAFALQEVQIKAIQDLQNDRFYRKPHPYIWGSLSLSQTGNSY